MQKSNNSENFVALMFLLVPTIFVILGLIFFPYDTSEMGKIVEMVMFVPLFGSLVLLGIGFFLKKDKISNKLKIAGWIIFVFYWSTRTNSLYFSEGGDFANAFLCIAGVYVLFYIAYHEWLSLIRNENVECLNWIAGAAAIAGIIYFGTEMTTLQMWLREIVAAQSAWVLNIFTGSVAQQDINIVWKQAHVGIIFACTAVQSMVLFVGMMLPLTKVDVRRKCYGLLITVIPIYLLNLVRNALVVYLVGINGPDFFFMAHNVIGKGGSLIALVVLLLIVIKILPELFDEIMSLINIYKRDGPIERFFKRYFGRKKAA